MGGKLRHTHGRSIEIMIQLKKGAKTTNVLIQYLSELKSYETYPQRTNVCGYLAVCRKAGMIKTRKLRQARFHQHSLTSEGEYYLEEVRNNARL